jgi:hypothetical protein
VHYAGVYGDGWVGREAQVTLPGGEAGHLVLRATVLAHPDQRLELKLDGRTLVDRSVGEGPLDLRIPVPATPGSRTVELTWAGTTQLNDGDPREAAALIQFLNVTAPRAPTSLRVEALANPAIDHSGITRDGWIGKNAHVVLVSGPSCDLVIRGKPLDVTGQHLEVAVDGQPVHSAEIEGDLDLRIPISAADNDRRIELNWSKSTAVSISDSRQVAAHLTFIGLATGRPPTALRRFPGDLADPNLVYSGISSDGWLGRDAHVVLDGGPAGDLVIRGELVEMPEQHLKISVDGEAVASEVLDDDLDLRIPIPATEAPRRIALHWRRAAAVSSTDTREAAAHLTFIGVSTGRPPTALRRFPSDLADAELEYSGILDDGWVEQDAHVVLAGGAAADLIIRGTLLDLSGQHLEVTVDGGPVAAEHLRGTTLDLRIPVPATDTPRRVALHWALSGPVSRADQRRAAAHLATLAVFPRVGR